MLTYLLHCSRLRLWLHVLSVCDDLFICSRPHTCGCFAEVADGEQPVESNWHTERYNLFGNYLAVQDGAVLILTGMIYSLVTIPLLFQFVCMSKLEWTECAKEYLPCESGLCDKAEHNVSSLSKKIIFPRTNLFILQKHVHSE